jgi:hypothetical protein
VDVQSVPGDTQHADQVTDLPAQHREPPANVSLDDYRARAAAFLSSSGRLTGDELNVAQNELAAVIAYADGQLDTRPEIVSDLVTPGLRHLPQAPGSAYLAPTQDFLASMVQGAIVEAPRFALTERPEPSGPDTIELRHTSGRPFGPLVGAGDSRIAFDPATRFQVLRVGEPGITLVEIDPVATPVVRSVEPPADHQHIPGDAGTTAGDSSTEGTASQDARPDRAMALLDLFGVGDAVRRRVSAPERLLAVLSDDVREALKPDDTEAAEGVALGIMDALDRLAAYGELGELWNQPPEDVRERVRHVRSESPDLEDGNPDLEDENED